MDVLTPTQTRPQAARQSLSVVVPVYNEQAVLPEFHRRLAAVLDALAAFIYGAYVIVKTLVYCDPVPGYPTLVVLVLFGSGLQLMALGIIGEYLARMFVEVKGRPLYLVQRNLLPARLLPPPAETPAS